jgi:mgtE-like transporter
VLIDAALVAVMAIAVFTLIGAAAVGLAALTGDPAPAPLSLVGSTLIAGIGATPVLLITGYYLAIVTYRIGLDPDDQTVPILTSLMDLAGVVILLAVMTHFGILPVSA